MDVLTPHDGLSLFRVPDFKPISIPKADLAAVHGEGGTAGELIGDEPTQLLPVP